MKIRGIIKKPIITEKSLGLSETENKYTFEVAGDANKIDVVKAIEDKFRVKVLNVRMMNTLGKGVNFGRKRLSGKRSDVKKAIVTLKAGDSIKEFNLN